MADKRECTGDSWHYTMTPEETASWNTATRTQRQLLLEDMASRVMCEAADHGHTRFAIFDNQGSLVARGKLEPGDIQETLEAYRAQQRWN
ncbi:MAG: hypothetical protein AMXMBFR84_46330 [Candidatus Hydrogenedentota bacterium]